MTSLSLRSNFTWTLSANAIYGVYQWTMIAVIAKLAGPIVVGQFSLALAIITPVQMFFNLQLRALQASDPSNKFSFSDYLALRMVGVGLTTTLIMVVSFAWRAFESAPYALIGVLGVKALESVSDIFYGSFQNIERMDISSKARILDSSLGLLAFTVTFYMTRDLFSGLLAIVVALFLVLSCYTIPSFQRAKDSSWYRGLSHIKPATLRSLASLAFPLGVTMAVSQINGSVPRLALERYTSSYDVGIFAGLMQLVIAGTIVIGALGQAVTPRLARLLLDEETERFFALLNRLQRFAFFLGSAGAVVAYFLGDVILTIVYTRDYASHTPDLVVLAVAAGFTFAASFQGYALTSARITSEQVWMLAAVGGVTATILAMLVRPYGILGACFAVLGGAITHFLLSRWILRTRVTGGQGTE